MTPSFVRFSPLTIEAVEKQALHANDACLSCRTVWAIQQCRQALLHTVFVCLLFFAHTPAHQRQYPVSPFGLEYPVGTFHSLFSMLQEVGWSGKCNGLQNSSEQT